MSVFFGRGLQRGAGVRIDLTVQRDFFKLRCGPLHSLYPFFENTLTVRSSRSIKPL